MTGGSARLLPRSHCWCIAAPRFPYISYDDPGYVSANIHVQRGLSAAGVRWAFTTGEASNWHPLTWLSHMLDWQLFGNHPGPQHLVNVLFHVANALLLFWVLKRLAGATWRSALVAGLFALHPLHVESVAWISERKDVLSTFFMLLALLAYERYARTRRAGWYGAVILGFVLGLLAKPMVITLPVVLLLLDFWPLDRRDWGRAWLEKLPMFALAAASGVVTFMVQRAGGAVASIVRVPVELRISNALVSYVRYLGKMILPIKLAVFYPMPQSWPTWEWGLAAALLISATALVVAMRRRAPWLVVGWLWYLVALVPVIGLVQVGEQALADRYSYMPLVGIFIMIAWSIRNVPARIAAPVCAMVLGALAMLTFRQLGYWGSNLTLFEHAAKVTRDNWMAYNHMATGLSEENRLPEALEAATRALNLHPSVMTYYDMGNLLRKMGDLTGAQRSYHQALELNPHLAVAHLNIGVTLVQLGDLPGAQRQFQAAIAADPQNAGAYENLGLALRDQGRLEQARLAFEQALRLNPDHSIARRGLKSLRDKQSSQ